jgi:death-on-curing protein
MSDYLTLVEALAIHDDQIERYGGLSGVRDHGILEAALYRPQTGYYADLIEEATALWESLAQNHPFIDGNKRTAFAATYTFLAINGTHITADAESAYAFIAGLYKANDFTFENLLAWLRENVAPTTTGAATTTLSRKPSQDSAQTSMRSK